MNLLVRSDGSVVHDEGGLERGVLRPAELHGDAAAGEAAQREAVLGVAGVAVEVGEGAQGGAVRGDGQLVELATVIGLFNFFNRFADALQILPLPGATGKD